MHAFAETLPCIRIQRWAGFASGVNHGRGSWRECDGFYVKEPLNLSEQLLRSQFNILIEEKAYAVAVEFLTVD